jgi:outer membrane lipoprotein SlyB
MVVAMATGLSVESGWAACPDCGVVQSIKTVEQKGESKGVVGAVAGGLLGGVLGHQIGGGRGKDVATVAGAVGGAVVGNQVEKNLDKKAVFEMSVKMEDGTARTTSYDSDPGFKAGDPIKWVKDKWLPLAN